MRKGLGRGLDAILAGKEEPGEDKGRDNVRALAVSRLVPNRFQPRAGFSEEGLEELAQSIRAQGVIQPLVVARRSDGKYTIIAGERRWRAARRCGLEQVPVVVREIDDDRELLELALVENIQRADLDAIEEAEAYRSLRERFDLTQEQIASRVGRARSTITNTLRLLRLPAEIQDLVRGGSLTAGQVRPLLALDSAERQVELAERIARDGLNARRVEGLVHRERGARKPRREKDVEGDVHTAAAAEELTRALQTKVEIRRSGQRGTVRIHFQSEDELMRLYERLIGRGGPEASRHGF